MSRATRAHLAIEPLEDRLAPATFTVVNSDGAGTGSLRWAINRANTTPGADRIEFAIGSGAQTINLTSGLPAITDRVTIAAQTQLGFAGMPLIEMNGAGIGGGGSYGLWFGRGASGSAVRGLIIVDFTNGDGIHIRAEGCSILGNIIGTNAVDATSRGNQVGIGISGIARGNVIGGLSASARNIISGNLAVGVKISDPGATGNMVLGNFIGTNAAGTAALSNSDGVYLTNGASGNFVGAAVAGARNVISGNIFHGVRIDGGSTAGNRVLGNYIGTDKTGTSAVENFRDGVHIDGGAHGNFVGTADAGSRNVISGNGDFGVLISGFRTTGNRVAGNYIGMDKTGLAALGNDFGVYVDMASSNIVGGTTAAARNIISGNSYGVYMTGEGTSGNLVIGNFIGPDKTGAAGAGNSLGGVAIGEMASGNTIGGVTAGTRNVVSGGESSGIYLFGLGTTNNRVIGNYIGTDVTGTLDLGFAWNGVSILDGADGNFVGGTQAGAGNVISGNGLDGVNISGAGTNRVLGNRIGLSATSAAALPNAGNGVQITGGASGNRVGSSAAGAGNVIAHNVLAGVFIESGTGNAVRGNRIFSNGGLGIDLVGPVPGVTENDADDVDVGPNDLLNFPELELARLTPFGLRIRGSINTETDRILRLDFYVSPAADDDPSGHGEGRRYLGFATVEMGTNNTAPFNELLAVSGMQVGDVVTATATDEQGNTSEFSLWLTLS